MKQLFTSILMLATAFSAYAGTPNLEGTWVGKRYQYNDDHTSYQKIFTYIFDLKQDGNEVKGTTYIKNEDGSYAEMAVRGLIEDDKLYFQEYEIFNAVRPEGKVWCLKSGVLNIFTNEKGTALSGETNSYMEQYGDMCSGGVTYISKLTNDVYANEPTTDKVEATAENKDALFIQTFPNPFVESADIRFSLASTQNVKVEILDLSGKIISTLQNGKLDGGTHLFTFTSANKTSNTMYIAKVTMGEKVYTNSLIQMR
jgi:hypothetical protein